MKMNWGCMEIQFKLKKAERPNINIVKETEHEGELALECQQTGRIWFMRERVSPSFSSKTTSTHFGWKYESWDWDWGIYSVDILVDERIIPAGRDRILRVAGKSFLAATPTHPAGPQEILPIAYWQITFEGVYVTPDAPNWGAVKVPFSSCFCLPLEKLKR